MAKNIHKLNKKRNHWNAKGIIHDGKKATEFHGGWLNFLDEKGEWKEIDCIVKQEADGFRVVDAPFNFFAPLTSDGIAEFETDVRYDIHNKVEITEAAMKQTIRATQAASVAGELFDINGDGRLDAVIYRNAFPQWNADLIYYVKHGRAPRLEKLVRFNTAPTEDIDIDFDITYNEDTDIDQIEREEITNRKGKRSIRSKKTRWNKSRKSRLRTREAVMLQKRGTTQKRGIGMKNFFIWDSNETVEDHIVLQKKESIDVTIERTESKHYKLTKHIKAAFFADAVLPVFTDTVSTFYPDPNVETTSMDGYLRTYNEGTVWATERANSAISASGVRADDTNMYLGAAGFSNNGNVFIARGSLIFDTSSIPDADSVTDAVLSTYVISTANEENDGDDYIAIVGNTQASATALVTGDFDQLIGDALDNPTEFHDVGERVDVSTVTTSAYHDWQLNAAGIANVSKTGVSKFAGREGHDLINSATAATMQNNMNIAAAETAGTTQDPKLVVTHAGGDVSIAMGTAAIAIAAVAMTVTASAPNVSVSLTTQDVAISAPSPTVTAVSPLGLSTKSLDMATSSTIQISDAAQTGLDIASDWTWESWFKGDSLTANFVDKWIGSGSQRSYALTLQPTIMNAYVSADGSTTSPVASELSHPITIVTGTWYHMAVAYDASAKQFRFTLKLEDGTEYTASVASSEDGAVYNSTAAFIIGQNIDGHLYEYRLWSTYRTETEISDNYNKSLEGDETGLELYLRFQDDLTDDSPNGNDMTGAGTYSYSTDIPDLSSGVTVNAATAAIAISTVSPTVTALSPNVSVGLSTQDINIVVPSASAITEGTVSIGLSTQDIAISVVSPTVSAASIDPSGLVATTIDANSISLSWVKGSGSDRTFIVMKEGSAPANATDGFKVYNGYGNSTIVNHLDAGTEYHFAAFGNSETYALGTENIVATAEVPLTIDASDQFIFISQYSGGGVEVRRRDDPTTLLATIDPTEVGTDTIGNIQVRGKYLAFSAAGYCFLYEFIDESNYTQLLVHDSLDTPVRAVHIDDELEYVYFGTGTGDIIYFDIATLTKTTYTVGTLAVRDIDTHGDQLVTATNDQDAYSIDRSTRTAMGVKDEIGSYSGYNMEVARIDDDYIYIGGDTTRMDIREKTSPYTVVDTVNSSGNDITKFTIEDGRYHAMSSDDNNVYIIDADSSFATISTITSPSAQAEGAAMLDGDLYYTAGYSGQKKLYYRTYITDSLSAGSSVASANTIAGAAANTANITISAISPVVTTESSVSVVMNTQSITIETVTPSIVADLNTVIAMNTASINISAVPVASAGSAWGIVGWGDSVPDEWSSVNRTI